MLNSEFNLYKREWLSLVFKNRNQQYGAYELRSHYSDVMLRSMGLTFFIVAAVAGTVTVISHNRPVETKPVYHYTEVPIPDKIYEAKPKELDKPKPKQQSTKAAQPVSTQNINYVPKPDELVKKDPEPVKADVVSGSVDKTIPGDGREVAPIIETAGGTGEGNGPAIDNTTYNVGDGGLQVMPEPVGGDKAWAKFLQKNLRYPAMAQDQGVSGKVYLSFIIEKDGHLSNITVERKAGYGFDEEASRVLKLAAAWKPGQQNGQPVRVRYIIPINFQQAEQ